MIQMVRQSRGLPWSGLSIIKLFRQETDSLFKIMLIADEFIRRLEMVGGRTRVTLTGGSPLNIAGFLNLAPGPVFIS